ncbi:SpoIIIAH-like family protein [Clostridium niameyense]|uniref:SpoIIIAH-like family protein n=1 Tax=Clostridium niameyense TaxID=1622073 RepID=A0A6M0R7U8_9CLOT|nr:SpoIIIAH-like family protein [Clostridium niameyense]NEZ46306.1 SpoIIIAH-like family protein [Clostridium niameyense]
MNKKQGAIIVTLLALIVCTGVIATKLNNPLYVNGTEEGTTVSFNDTYNNSKKEEKKTNANTSQSEFFAETKLTRDQKTAQTLQTLKSLIDDKNVPKENKKEAVEKYTKLAMNSNYESKIESVLKSKGYDDVVCSIENNKVRIMVKGKEKLTDKQTRDIRNVVVNVSNIQEVEIETKQ